MLRIQSRPSIGDFPSLTKHEGGVQEEAIANWSKCDFPLILITFHIFITGDLLLNPQAQLNLCSSCAVIA